MRTSSAQAGVELRLGGATVDPPESGEAFHPAGRRNARRGVGPCSHELLNAHDTAEVPLRGRPRGPRERARRTAPLDVLRAITDEGTQRRKEDSMRKQLTVVTALAVVAASAAPAAARPVVPFPPGTSDAAQAGYESPPATGTTVATDLRGDAAREAAAPAVTDLRGDAAREPAAAGTAVATDLRGEPPASRPPPPWRPTSAATPPRGRGAACPGHRRRPGAGGGRARLDVGRPRCGRRPGRRSHGRRSRADGAPWRAGRRVALAPRPASLDASTA